MSGVCAIVPVRAGGVGKSRLAGVLSPQRRERLIETMLGEVLAALRGARGIDAIVVVSPDLEQAPAGTTLLRDGGEGLNAAVSLALAALGSRFTAALVVAADVPRVTAAEIETLLQACRDADPTAYLQDKGTDPGARLRALVELATDSRARRLSPPCPAPDIEDPYRRGDEAYQLAYAAIRAAADAIVAHVTGDPG